MLQHAKKIDEKTTTEKCMKRKVDKKTWNKKYKTCTIIVKIIDMINAIKAIHIRKK